MKYLLKRIRFLDKYDNSPSVYTNAVKSYYKHLLKMGFASNRSLLKYFGDDFFHDAIISSVTFDAIKRKITLNIIREEADREDINYFRKPIGLKPISKAKFINNPILYECEFYNTDGLNGILSYLDEYPVIAIMDAEIERLKKRFKLTLSTANKTEFWFTFTRSRVRILSGDIIRRYTAGKRSSVPYCETCRSRILTKQMMRKYLKVKTRKS